MNSQSKPEVLSIWAKLVNVMNLCRTEKMCFTNSQHVSTKVKYKYILLIKLCAIFCDSFTYYIINRLFESANKCSRNITSLVIT